MPPESAQLPRRALLHPERGRWNESVLLLLSPLLHPGRGCEGLRASQISAATPLLTCSWSLFAKTSSLLAGLLPLPEGVMIDMESKEMCTKANIIYDCLLFDLDDTLYLLSFGIAAECRKNILEYMLEKLKVEESNLLELCTVLYKHYRTTMAGLKIFTNGDQAHVAKVLNKLDLEDYFDTVTCFETLNPPSSSFREDNSANIFDIIGYLLKPDPNVDLPKRILSLHKGSK
ncbi:hypothetical protein ZIOFF_050810 [Zingiber officinale]|uniref:Uncharacterized protein n=1 Tax=Zingiber officinale TaxID=94328 RepID=A0A8J5FS68_ZINOF|nr:hypothetical protein ZIOFF_050810 [Zingiber officinale]